MAVRYQLTLLGSFGLRDDERRECALPSRRLAALLACLALESPASRAELAEHLWPDRDHAASRRNLRRELARMRDAGLHALLDADTHELALGSAVQTDAAAALQAVHQGDLATALAEWSGPLLAGFTLAEAPAFDAWLQTHREAWAQRWREVAQAHAEHLEQEGALREALHWQERLRAESPLQERHHAAVMRLHHRLGEPGAALAAFGHCEAVLRSELGVAPSTGIQALAERMRAAQRMAPALHRAVEVPCPGLDLPLIGRDAESATLAETSAPVLLIEGEPGVGKTRLVQETLRATTTLAMPCAAQARHCALYPVGEALTAALASPLHAERLARVPARARREAARWMPALAAPGMPPAEGPLGDAAERERLFEALADLMDALATPTGTLWIDDLHEADEATLSLLALLAHRRGQAPQTHVRVVVAARLHELEAHSLAADLVRRLRHAGLLQTLSLAPLTLAQTQHLVRVASGAAVGGLFAARLQRATHGNPLHLVETLRFLLDSGEVQRRTDGRWHTRYDEATTDYAELPVPPTLAATIVDRVGRLSVAARQLVEAATLSRPGFTLAQLQPATALDDWAAVDGLEEALRLRLFTQVAVGDTGRLPRSAPLPRYRLAHEITRDALVPTLRPERRRLIHERLAGALIAQHAAADHVAWHLGQAGLADQALPWHLDAAQEARQAASWPGALWHLEQAWTAMDAAEPGLRLDCLHARIDAARRGFDLAAMARAIDDLQTEGARTADAAMGLEALVLRAELGQLRKAPVPAIAPLRDALLAGRFDALPPLRLRAVVALGTALLAAGQVDAAQAVLSDARAVEGDGDAPQRASLLCARANAARLSQQPAQALGLLQAALAHLDGPTQVEARLQALNLLAHTQFMLGQPREAVATLEAALADAEKGRIVPVLRTVLPNLVTLHVVQGDLPRARRYLQRGMRALRSVDNPATHAALFGRLAELEITAGQLGAALQAARESMARFETNGGGSQDYAPWVLCGVVFDCAGAPERTASLFSGLPASPACTPGAGPAALVRLKTLAASVPAATAAQAQAIADALQALRQAPEAAYPAAEADFWCALALHQAGRPAEALALAESIEAADLGLAQHSASLWALRLRAATAANVLTPTLVAHAEAQVARAPPVPALDLACALAAAHDALKDVAAAERWSSAGRRRAKALASSLAGEHPDLAASLLHRWQGALRRSLDRGLR